VQRDKAIIERLLDFSEVTEDHAVADFFSPIKRQVVEAQDDILRRHDDWLAVGRRQDVVGRHHQYAAFQLGLKAQRHVDSHLVAIEVSVERGANQRVKLDRLAFNQFWFEGLDTEAVQRRRAVEQDRVLADHLVEDVPHFRLFFLNQLLGSLDRSGQAFRVETRIDERLEQFEGHLLGKTALVQFQVSRPACREGSGGSGPACLSACPRSISADACWCP